MAFLDISRGLIFANSENEKISRGLIFANEEIIDFFQKSKKSTKTNFKTINFKRINYFKTETLIIKIWREEF